MSPDQSTSVALMGVSRDGSLVTYGIRTGGEDEVRVRFLDTESRKELEYEMPRARYAGVAILPDRSGVYYSKWTPEGTRAYFHAMSGSGPDREIFGAGYGPSEYVATSLSEDGHYLGISVEFGSAADKTEFWVKDLRTNGPIKPVIRGIDARFEPEFAGDRVYVSTNWKAPNGRVLMIDLQNPAQENWKEVIAEGESTLEEISAAGGMIAANYLENVSTRIRIFDAVESLSGKSNYRESGQRRGRSDPGQTRRCSTHSPRSRSPKQFFGMTWRAESKTSGSKPKSLSIPTRWMSSRSGTHQKTGRASRCSSSTARD